MVLMGCNLIRRLMVQAAARPGRPLHRLSFAGAVDRLKALPPYLCSTTGPRAPRRWMT